jgi:hypothetical protein
MEKEIILPEIMKYFLALFVFCLCSCNSAASSQPQNENVPIATPTLEKTVEVEQATEQIVSDIPKTFWERIFFEAINERSKEAQITKLRETDISPKDIEVRVWMGFGLTKLEGFILKRIGEKWSATKITTDYVSKKFVSKNIELSEPQIGWNQAWQKLLDAGILTLPDAESINCKAGATDGFSFVVEAKKGGNYRTYMYDNPNISFKDGCKEAGQMIEIYKITRSDYGFK